MYKDEIFMERYCEGLDGSGYDWNALARVFIMEIMPELSGIIKFDSESSMFCVYSEEKEAVFKFAAAFHTMCENESLMKKLFSKAKLE